MNKTAIALAFKDCVVHTLYSEIGGVFMYNWYIAPVLLAKKAAPGLAQLTLIRMSVNFGTCMIAKYIVSYADTSNEREFDIFIAGGARVSAKAGIIRFARQVSDNKFGSWRVLQSSTCGMVSGFVNALVEPLVPVLIGNTTSFNILPGDTANALCNVAFEPTKWRDTMQNKVTIGLLREISKPIAEFLGDRALEKIQVLFSQGSDSQDASPVDNQVTEKKVSDGTVTENSPSDSCNPVVMSGENYDQSQVEDCTLSRLVHHSEICLAGDKAPGQDEHP